MRHMKPTSVLVALVMMLIFLIGGSYLVTKPSSQVYDGIKETQKMYNTNVR